MIVEGSELGQTGQLESAAAAEAGVGAVAAGATAGIKAASSSSSQRQPFGEVALQVAKVKGTKLIEIRMIGVIRGTEGKIDRQIGIEKKVGTADAAPAAVEAGVLAERGGGAADQNPGRRIGGAAAENAANDIGVGDDVSGAVLRGRA